MLVQLVDVVSALVLVGLTLGALFPAARLATGRDPARPGPRPVLWGALAGAVLGLVMIVVHHYALIRFDRQRLTLTTLEPTVALGVAVLGLTWWLGRRTLRELGGSQGLRAGRPQVLIANPIPPSLRMLTSIVVGLWAMLIVFRDSQMVYMQVRTLVPLGASIFSTATFLNVLGYIFGVVLVLVCAIALTRVCQIRPTYTLPLLTILTVLISLTHIFLIIRLLHAIRAIYLSTGAAASVTWLVTHESWLILAALAVTAGVAFPLWNAGWALPAAGPNPAAQRLQRASSRSMTRRATLTMAASTLAFLVLTVGERYATEEVELSEPEPFEVKGEKAVIALPTLNDGHLHRFSYDSTQGVAVRWIVIQKAGSSYGVGLDACEICGPSGYYEKDGQVICKLCSVAMNVATIGFKGGCNPIPIEYEVVNNVLTIPIAELEKSAAVFT
ncbi:Fe-S-containing protein [Gephyromycinifex aptenodytis]|uniref:Fe-S-containing protein n=1 Tax=Gephyromycinifex aptenodytis TaxID=2716227 RepID=UPI001445E9E0|nr:Fe-S-containing protein [Gephyromycinifex aptenodytis]